MNVCRFEKTVSENSNPNTNVGKMNRVPRLKLEKLGIKKSSNKIKSVRPVSTKLERGGGVKKKFQQHYIQDVEKKQVSHERKLRKLS